MIIFEANERNKIKILLRLKDMYAIIRLSSGQDKVFRGYKPILEVFYHATLF